MNIRLLLLTLLLPVFASAQFLAPETPLQQAFIEATQKDKLIFLMIESAECQQCNDVADKALQNDSLKNDLKKNFVSLRISPIHPDLNYIKEKYIYHGGNIVLFLDKWGTLVHRMNISTSRYDTYVKEAMIASLKKTEADHVRTLEKEALTGHLDITRLYALLELRKLLALPTEELLDQYVSQLPADSLTTLTTLQRIASMSPVLDSKADWALRKNQELFNQAWYALPLKERLAINNQIIFKSRQQAIADKKISKAKAVATFSKNVHTGKEAGDNAYHYNMMEYFRGIQDTAAYLKAAVNYYDQFQMTVSAAEMKKRDSLRMADFAKKHLPKDTIIRRPANSDSNKVTVKTITRVSSASFSPTSQRHGEALHYGARSFYLMTNDQFYLKKALQWAAYANEFYDSPYALDIWARLLYKVDKNVDQAIQLEEKAISLLKTRGYATDTHNAVLDKMKNSMPID